MNKAKKANATITEKRFDEWINTIHMHKTGNNSRFIKAVFIDLPNKEMLIIHFNTDNILAGYRGIVTITHKDLKLPQRAGQCKELFRSRYYEDLINFEYRNIIGGNKQSLGGINK